MELNDPEEAMGIRKTLAHDIRLKKNPQVKEDTFWGFLRIFMKLCWCKAQLAPPHRNCINGVANPEAVYMLLRFQILCIDRFFFFFKKALTLTGIC